MGGVSRPQNELGELIAELEAYRLDEPHPLRAAVSKIRKLLAIDAIAIARAVGWATGSKSRPVDLDGFPNPTKARKLLGDLIDAMADPALWLELEDRSASRHDAAIGRVASVRRDALVRSPLYKGVVVPLGLEDHHVIRMRLGEPNMPLGWLVGFSLRAISRRATGSLEALHPVLSQRLRIARSLETTPRLRATLSLALEQLDAPVVVVDTEARIFEANSSARALLEHHHGEVVGSLRSHLANQGGTIPLTLTRIAAGEDSLYLAVVQRQSSEDRLALAASRAAYRWQLTPRQVDVLQLLVRGETNATIAQSLGISTRSAELHISNILDRARVSNRAALVASLLIG